MATQRVCAIPECGKHHYSRGWCILHYSRWLRHGSPTGGATSRRRVGYDGDVHIFLKSTVLPHTGDDCLKWPYAHDPNGYGQIRIDGRSFHVHRMVCEAIHGPPPSSAHQAAHSCGKGHEGCCAPGHLSWKTPLANAADRIVHGTTGRGERCSSAKLTEADVRSIRALKETVRQSVIARQFGVSPVTVHNILNGATWAWLD